MIGSLGPGGAERVMTIMANWWTSAGHRVEILTLQSVPSFFALDPRVRVVSLGLGAATSHVERAVASLRRVVRLRRALRRSAPDAIVSFIDVANVHALLASVGTGIPIIISERTDPRQHRIGWFWNALRRVTYPMAHCLVVQSAEVAPLFPRLSGRTVVLPNPVLEPPPEIASMSPAVDLVAMGRFTVEKGFDQLLEALALVVARRGPTTLRVWGDGPERSALIAQAERLGLARLVEFPGRTDAPSRALASGRVFVLPSRYEGFPNVLGEAMALGMACIAMDSSSGPRQLVRDGVDGLLVAAGDVQGLATSITRLLDDGAERERLGVCARSVVERFGLATVMAGWDTAIGDAAARGAA